MLNAGADIFNVAAGTLIEQLFPPLLSVILTDGAESPAPQTGVSIIELVEVLIDEGAELPLYSQPLPLPKFQTYPVIPVSEDVLLMVKVTGEAEPQGIEPTLLNCSSL